MQKVESDVVPKISRSRVRFTIITAVLMCSPAISHGEILWSGDFDTGDFVQWHRPDDSKVVNFHEIPVYGRPIQYGFQHSLHIGDGSLLSLVQNPTRYSPYAAKFTVKNSVNGSEPADCDNGLCSRRRTVVTVQKTLPEYYNALPYMSERWMSVSVYVPSDWEAPRNGWGPSFFSLKPLVENGSAGLSGPFNLAFDGESFRINHRWSDIQNPTMDQVPWQQSMFYTADAASEGGGPYPRPDFWSDGLRDYPDVATSQAALGDLNRGGWTDWVVNVKFDARGSNSGGTGFLTVWKRAGSGPWVKVLHVVPKVTSRGTTFDHGIGYNSPPGSGHNGGFGIKAGMYMEKENVWNNQRNRVLYLDNIKVGDERSTFGDMSPDGSTPSGGSTPPNVPEDPAKPNPPTLQ